MNTMPENVSFGAAFSLLDMQSAGIQDFLTLPEFNCMELPWEIISMPDSVGEHILHEASVSKIRLICGGIMDSQLSRSIPFAEKRLQDDFIVQLRKTLEQLAQKDVHTATLECPLEGFIGDPEAVEAMRKILLGAAPVLLKYGITLLLPFSIPGTAPELASRFLRNTMIPNVKLRLDVHQWSIPKNTSIEKLAGLLNYETRVLVFRYDADSGCMIRKDAVKTWLKYLERANFGGEMLIAPKSQHNRMALAEAETFAEIIRTMRNEPWA